MGSVFQTGVIDVGAHSVRLDIFEVRKGELSLIESLARAVNLGSDVFRRGAVSAESLSQLSEILCSYSRKLTEYRITDCRVIATSAIREASNRELVISRIRNNAHLEMEILTPQEELRISYLAMRECLGSQLNFPSLEGLCLIIGTGSLLICYFEKGLMRFCEEIATGTARFIDAFGRQELSLSHLTDTLGGQEIPLRIRECVGSSGDRPLSLIAMGASVRELAGERAVDENKLLRLSPEELNEAIHRWLGKTPEQLAAENDELPEVAAATSACAGILSCFNGIFRFREFICPAVTTRSAVASELVRSRRKGGEDPFEADLRSLVLAGGRKYGFDRDHAEQVEHLSEVIYEKLRRSYSFSRDFRRLLSVGALLHDVGRFVDIRNHQEHSFYLISQMRLPGVSDEEQNMIALAALCHRKKVHLENRLEYRALPPESKVTVLKLAAILRVADALDSARSARFDRMKLACHGHWLEIQVPECGDLQLERFYLSQKGDLFSEVFGLELKLQEAPLN